MWHLLRPQNYSQKSLCDLLGELGPQFETPNLESLQQERNLKYRLTRFWNRAYMCSQHRNALVLVRLSLLPGDLCTPSSSEVAGLKCPPDVCRQATAKPSRSNPAAYSTNTPAKHQTARQRAKHMRGRTHMLIMTSVITVKCSVLHMYKHRQTRCHHSFNCYKLEVSQDLMILSWHGCNFAVYAKPMHMSLKAFTYHFTMERGGCWVIIVVHSLTVWAAISSKLILKEETITVI